MFSPQRPPTNRVTFEDDPYKGLKEAVMNNTVMMALQYALRIVEDQRKQIASLQEQVAKLAPRPAVKKTTAKDEDNALDS